MKPSLKLAHKHPKSTTLVIVVMHDRKGSAAENIQWLYCCGTHLLQENALRSYLQDSCKFSQIACIMVQLMHSSSSVTQKL